MDTLEQELIALYKTQDPEFGYNRESGGNKHKHLSEETKEKISKANKGRFLGEKHWNYGKHLSEDTKKKISEARKGKFLGEDNPFFGKHHTEETKKKISEAKKGKCAGENAYWYGKHHSEESKKKMSEAKKGKMPVNAKPVICLETKEIFQSTGLAAKAMNLKSSKRIYIACIDHSRTSGGYHWRYLEDYNKENNL